MLRYRYFQLLAIEFQGERSYTISELDDSGETKTWVELDTVTSGTWTDTDAANYDSRLYQVYSAE